MLGFRDTNARYETEGGDVTRAFRTCGLAKKQEDTFVVGMAEGVTDPTHWMRSQTEEIRELTRNSQDFAVGTIVLTGKDGVTVGHIRDTCAVAFVQDAVTGKVAAHKLTRDHDPLDEKEMERIIRAGGVIEDVDFDDVVFQRVHSSYPVTRCWGGRNSAVFQGGLGITDEAEINHYPLGDLKKNADDRVFVFVATDGLFATATKEGKYSPPENYITPEDYALVVENVLRTGKGDALNAMVNYAASRGQFYNATGLFTEILPDAPTKVLAVFDGQSGDAIKKERSSIPLQKGAETSEIAVAVVQESLIPFPLRRELGLPRNIAGSGISGRG